MIPTCVDPAVYPIAVVAEGRSSWSGSVPRALCRVSSKSRPIWHAWPRRLPGVKLRVICDRFPESFPLPIIPVLWDEQTEVRELAAGHIGISWIPDDLWSRGKCGLKVLQYQAAGLPVVANPVGAHREMIREGETGFLASTPVEWVAGRRAGWSPTCRCGCMGRQGRQQVEANYSVSAWADTFVTSMTGISPASPGAFLEDRSSRTDRGAQWVRAAFGRTRQHRTFNQIGDR